MLDEDAELTGAPRSIREDQRRGGKHLLELINAVLRPVEDRGGQDGVILEDFDVARLVQDVAAVIKPLAGEERQHLEVRARRMRNHAR
jgi:signal transduction histidine kinase